MSSRNPFPRCTVVWLALFLFALPSLTKARSSDTSSRSAECQVVELAWGPGWVTSGVWRPAERGLQLLLADAGRDALLSFSEDGELLRQFRHVRNPVRDSFSMESLAHPVAVRPAGDASFWILDDGPEKSFSRLDVGQNRLEQRAIPSGVSDPRIPCDPESNSGCGPRPVGKIFDWAPLDAERILALAWLPEAVDASGVLEESYSVILLSSDGIEQTWNWIEDTTSEGWESQLFQYTFDLPAVATLEGRGYVFFAHQARPTIVELVPGRDTPRVLNEAPLSKADARPRLYRDPSWRGDRRQLEQHRQIEDSAMTVSLLSHGDSLFLIKKLAAEGTARDTLWTALQLDPETGRASQRLELPTTAPHLTLVPGHRWALIEKGPAQRLGGEIWGDHPFLPINSMVLVPHEWFLNPSSARACH